jgi:hypothetical protein
MVPDARQTNYVVDASSWISIEGHPAQNRILHRVVELIESGRIECPPEAWDEVLKCPWVHAWLDQYRDRLIKRHRQNGDYLALVGEIAHRFPTMSGVRGRKNKADPYVIANAVHGNRVTSDARFVVVANEGVGNRRKIPTACADYQVHCLTLMEMLRREWPDDGF